jgi:hypothetical protein
LSYIVSCGENWAPAVPATPVQVFVPDTAQRGAGRTSNVHASVVVPVLSVSATVTVFAEALAPLTPLSSPVAGPGATVRRHWYLVEEGCGHVELTALESLGLSASSGGRGPEEQEKPVPGVTDWRYGGLAPVLLSVTVSIE